MELAKPVPITVYIVWVKEPVSDVLQDISWSRNQEAQQVNVKFVTVHVQLALITQLFVQLVQAVSI